MSEHARMEPWRIHPHEPLTQLSPRVWRVEGRLPRGPLRRVMAVAKRADGSLLIHNGIAMEADAMAALDALGPVGAIVVPNGYHRMDAPFYAKRYPVAAIYCPAGSRTRVAEKVTVAGDYEAYPSDAEVRLFHLNGTKRREGVLQVSDEDGVTLVFNDAIFNMPHQPGVSGVILRHLTQSTGGPTLSRVFRWFLMADRKALAAHLTELAATPRLRRIIVSHHETIEASPGQVLATLAGRLR